MPEKPYPDDYDAATVLAKKELESGFRPKLKAKIKDIEQYDAIFVGYPIWWGTFPRPVLTFLSENNFSGKTIVPFCTNGGSRLGHSIEEITKLCPKSAILEGLAIADGGLENDSGAVTAWLRKLKMTK